MVFADSIPPSRARARPRQVMKRKKQLTDLLRWWPQPGPACFNVLPQTVGIPSARESYPRLCFFKFCARQREREREGVRECAAFSRCFVAKPRLSLALFFASLISKPSFGLESVCRWQHRRLIWLLKLNSSNHRSHPKLILYSGGAFVDKSFLSSPRFRLFVNFEVNVARHILGNPCKQASLESLSTFYGDDRARFLLCPLQLTHPLTLALTHSHV